MVPEIVDVPDVIVKLSSKTQNHSFWPIAKISAQSPDALNVPGYGPSAVPLAVKVAPRSALGLHPYSGATATLLAVRTSPRSGEPGVGVCVAFEVGVGVRVTFGIGEGEGLCIGIGAALLVEPLLHALTTNANATMAQAAMGDQTPDFMLRAYPRFAFRRLPVREELSVL
jgi:hypothetical protein